MRSHGCYIILPSSIVKTISFNILYSLQSISFVTFEAHELNYVYNFLFICSLVGSLFQVVKVLLRAFVCVSTHHNTPQIYKCSMITLDFNSIKFSSFCLLCILQCRKQPHFLSATDIQVFHNYIGFCFHKTFSFQFFVYITMQKISKISIYYAYYNEKCTSDFFCLYSSFLVELCELSCMDQLVPSPSRKIIALVNVVGIINVQQKMFSPCFEGYIGNRYGIVDVLGSGIKYIHCDLTNPLGYLIITLIVESSFISTFCPYINVGSFIHVLNFGVTFKNRFERGDQEFVSRVGVTIVIEQINLLPICLGFFTTHSILDFMQRANLEELRTMELVVAGIYGQFAKGFILVVANGLGNNDAHAFSIYLEFFAQYMQLVKMYNTRSPTILLVKNIGSSWFGEQQLVTKYATIFVIPTLDVTTVKRLIEIHDKRTESQNFATNFEVCSNLKYLCVENFLMR